MIAAIFLIKLIVSICLYDHCCNVNNDIINLKPRCYLKFHKNKTCDTKANLWLYLKQFFKEKEFLDAFQTIKLIY